MDIDDKIEYLVTGCFIKAEHKLQEMNVSKIYNWEGENQSDVCKVFIRFLSKIWVEWQDKIIPRWLCCRKSFPLSVCYKSMKIPHN